MRDTKNAPKVRGFEVVTAFLDKGINIPQRKTARSAGYDIESAEDVEVPPHGKKVIPTGLKAYMREDERLEIHIRSGISIKQSLSLLNDEGVIDADYYDNLDNEGHILVAFINHTDKAVQIKKGERIAQGIFSKYLLTDIDKANGKRSGGIGSTGKH